MSDTNRAINSMLEANQLFREQVQRSLDGVSASLDRTAAGMDEIRVQMAQLTTQVSLQSRNIDRLSQVVERLAQSIDAQRVAIDNHLEVAKQQSVNIAELTRLVTTQAQTVQILIQRAG